MARPRRAPRAAHGRPAAAARRALRASPVRPDLRLPANSTIRCSSRRPISSGRSGNAPTSTATGPSPAQGPGTSASWASIDGLGQRVLDPLHPPRQLPSRSAVSPSRASSGISVAQARPGEARVAVRGIVREGDIRGREGGNQPRLGNRQQRPRPGACRALRDRHGSRRPRHPAQARRRRCRAPSGTAPSRPDRRACAR